MKLMTKAAATAVPVLAVVAMVVPPATAAAGSRSCPAGRVVSLTTYVNGNAGATDVHQYSSGGQGYQKNFTGGGQHVSASPFQSATWLATTSANYYQSPTTTCLS